MLHSTMLYWDGTLTVGTRNCMSQKRKICIGMTSHLNNNKLRVNYASQKNFGMRYPCLTGKRSYWPIQKRLNKRQALYSQRFCLHHPVQHHYHIVRHIIAKTLHMLQVITSLSKTNSWIKPVYFSATVSQDLKFTAIYMIGMILC